MNQRDLFRLPERVLLGGKNDVRHFQLGCKSILNYTNTEKMPEAFTVNPYRGCEFGCAYCYARYTHEFMELGWDEFESCIFVKTGADRVLLKTLDHRALRGRPIIIGTATDPYQPAEVKYGLTRKLLKVFAEAQGLSISINTKSALAKRDVSLFQRVAASNDLRVNISLISMDEKLLRGLEPRASSPQARLEALRQISAAGISSGVFMMPILPGLTDSLNTLESVVREARKHGAQYLCSNILFLRKSSQLIFNTYLQDNHPELHYRYKELFAGRREVSKSYRRVVQTRVKALKEKYGFPETLPDRWKAPVEPLSVQLQLQGVA